MDPGKEKAGNRILSNEMKDAVKELPNPDVWADGTRVKKSPATNEPSEAYD